MKKKELFEKLLKMYEERKKYAREYQKNNYYKVSINVKKKEVEKLMSESNYDLNTAKKLLAYKKLKEELIRKGILKIKTSN